MSDPATRCLRLVLGLAAIGAVVCLLHLGSLRLGGEPGRLIEDNRNRDLEVQAIVYSEAGELEDFLDDEHGRYGRAAAVDALRSEVRNTPSD